MIFVQSYTDYWMFTYHVNNVFLNVLIYVDDLLIIDNSFLVLTNLKLIWALAFTWKIWALWSIFWVEVAQNLCQQKYALEIIVEAGLSGTNPLSTPLEPNHHLVKSTSTYIDMPDRY